MISVQLEASLVHTRQAHTNFLTHNMPGWIASSRQRLKQTRHSAATRPRGDSTERRRRASATLGLLSRWQKPPPAWINLEQFLDTLTDRVMHSLQIERLVDLMLHSEPAVLFFIEVFF